PARTDLAFIIKALNLVVPQTEVEGPVIIQGPLILHPKLLTLLHVDVPGGLAEDRSDRRARIRRVSFEVKQLGFILRIRVLELEARLQEMPRGGEPRVVESRPARVGFPLLIRRGKRFRCIGRIGQHIEGIRGEIRIGTSPESGELEKVAGVNVLTPDEMSVLAILL